MIGIPTSSSAPPFPPVSSQNATPPLFITSPTSTAHPSTLPGLTPSQDIDMGIGQESPLQHTATVKGSSSVKHTKQVSVFVCVYMFTSVCVCVYAHMHCLHV